MTAKEMFEKLGFNLSLDKSLGILRYIKTINSCTPTEYWHIDFHKGERIYQAYKQKSIFEERDYCLGIFFEWEKAINKQVEELGWNNE